MEIVYKAFCFHSPTHQLTRTTPISYKIAGIIPSAKHQTELGKEEWVTKTVSTRLPVGTDGIVSNSLVLNS